MLSDSLRTIRSLSRRTGRAGLYPAEAMASHGPAQRFPQGRPWVGQAGLKASPLRHGEAHRQHFVGAGRVAEERYQQPLYARAQDKDLSTHHHHFGRNWEPPQFKESAINRLPDSRESYRLVQNKPVANVKIKKAKMIKTVVSTHLIYLFKMYTLR